MTGLHMGEQIKKRGQMMKRLMKTVSLTAAAVLTALSLTACSGGGAKTIDVAKVADELNSSVITTDQLTETQSSMLSGIYFFEEGQVTNSKVYMSGNATADEICVVECKDEAAAKAVKDLLDTRVKNQADLFASYNPDEAAKLGDAIVKSAGKYAVMVVCDDYAKAESILKEAGF